MQFQIGDQVVHPVYGVGTIKTLAQRQFVGTSVRQYYEFIAGGVTVWVPIDDQGLTVMRGITLKGNLDECRRLLTSHPVSLDKDRQVRQLEIANRLKGQLLPGLCEMVRDLRAQSRIKPLGASESELLRKIFKALCEEWAVVDGVTSQVALREIESLLDKPQQPQAFKKSA